MDIMVAGWLLLLFILVFIERLVLCPVPRTEAARFDWIVKLIKYFLIEDTRSGERKQEEKIGKDKIRNKFKMTCFFRASISSSVLMVFLLLFLLYIYISIIIGPLSSCHLSGSFLLNFWPHEFFFFFYHECVHIFSVNNECWVKQSWLCLWSMVSIRGGPRPAGGQRGGWGWWRYCSLQFALSGRRLQCQDLFSKLSLDALGFFFFFFLRREAGVTERSAGLRSAAGFLLCAQMFPSHCELLFHLLIYLVVLPWSQRENV